MAKIKLNAEYHIHSEFSRDGSATIDEIARAALEHGLAEIAITDHGPRAMRTGLKMKNFPLITALVEKANAEHKIKVLQGLEANVIGRKGDIDVCDEVADKLDMLLVGMHVLVKPKSIKDFFLFLLPNWFWATIRVWPKGRIRKNTEIMKRVIENNKIDIWVHPNAYFRVNVVEVAKTCAEHGTMIELNRRINFRPIDWERMKAVGAKFVISNDFHSFEKHELGTINKVQLEFLDKVDWELSDWKNVVEK